MKDELLIALVQPSNVYWENPTANRAELEELLIDVVGRDLIILPEMCTTGFSMNAPLIAEVHRTTTLKWLQQQAAMTQATIIGGVAVKDDGRFYNRAYVVWPNGQFDWYDKRHLFGYAGENKVYSKGDKEKIVSVEGWNINLSICYDLRFPVSLRSQDLGYDALINIANWPQTRADQWLALLKARAIENLSFSIGVNRQGVDGHDVEYNGGSTAFTPSGRQLSKTTDDEVIYTSLSAKDLTDFRTNFPFYKDADPFQLL